MLSRVAVALNAAGSRADDRCFQQRYIFSLFIQHCTQSRAVVIRSANISFELLYYTIHYDTRLLSGSSAEQPE